MTPLRFYWNRAWKEDKYVKKKKDVYIQINNDNDIVSLFSIEKD